MDKKQAYIKNMLNIFKCMESVMLRRCLHIAFTHFNEAHSKHIKDNFQRKRHHNHEQDKKKWHSSNTKMQLMNSVNNTSSAV